MSRFSFLAALAAFLSASAFAEQFVMYAAGGDTDSVQRIDPIISPGTISGHVHQVFGASALRSDMSFDSLQDTSCTSVGSASGKGNAADNSVYWHPALYAQAKDGSGLVRIPTRGHKLYYQVVTNPKDKERRKEFPKGFRMIAGDPSLRSAATNVKRQNITQWICHSKSGKNQGTDGGFPTGVLSNGQSCDSYPGFNGAITFPSCYSGAEYNPANPFAHMSYAEGDISSGVCPDTHPIRLPQIFLENEFDVNGMKDKIKPDTFVLAQGDPTGYGWHADFFNGWEEGAIPALLASCPEEKYGNQDAGVCSAFKARSTKTNECRLPTQYVENVNGPNPSLPGCNPISNINPAPKLAIAGLGLSTCSGSDNAAVVLPSIVAPSIAVPTTLQTIAIPAAASSPSAVLTTVYSLPKAYGEPTTLLTSTRSQAPAAASSSSSSAISCPAMHGTTYVSNGATFEVECGTDHPAGDLSMKWVSGGLSECIDQCAQTSGCVDVSLSGSACYLKKSMGAAKSNAGVNGAKLVGATTSPPAAAPTGFDRDGLRNYVVVTEYQTVTAQATAYA